MRKGIIILALLAGACSKPSPQAMQDAAVPNDAPAPEMRVTAVPGVAMAYAYNFLLPVAKVAETQEKHAMQCELLGPARCRITGMAYHVIQSRQVQGSLEMKLAPALARSFGKQGIATVAQAGGMLRDSQITSTEAGATVAAADRDKASAEDEQKRIEAMLAQPKLSALERTQLQDRVAYLHDAKVAVANSRAEAAALLASTPVTFTYGSGVIDTGFGDGPWLAALKDGWANIVAGSLLLLTITISLVPWIVLALVLIWLWRRYGKRLGSSASSEE